MLTKQPPGETRDPNDLVPVLATALPGSGVDDVMGCLQQCGVTNAKKLTREIVSASVPRRCLDQLRAVARVEIKHKKDMHGG